MISLEKKDFTQKNLLKLPLNKSLLIQCSNLREIESSCNMARLAKKRFPELGLNFRTEQDTETFRILITRIA